MAPLQESARGCKGVGVLSSEAMGRDRNISRRLWADMASFWGATVYLCPFNGP